MKKKKTQNVKNQTSKISQDILKDEKIAKEVEKIVVIKTKKLESIINRSPVIAFLWRAEGNWPVEYVSENICQFGYKAEDFLNGKLFFTQIIYPDDLPQVTDEVNYYSQTFVDEFEQEYRIITKEGEIRWIDDRTWILRDDNNKITHYEGLIIDITERKLAEEELKISNQTVRNIIEYSPSLIYLFDTEGNFITGNENFEKLMGFPIKDFIGKKREQFFTTEISNMHRSNDLIVINTKQPLYLEEESMEKDGMHYYLSVKFPILDSNGKVYAVGGVSTDISDRKKAENEIKKLNTELEERVKTRTAQLEKINQELKMFSYSVSHDLKAPLRGIDGYSKLLQEIYGKDMDSEARFFVKNIRKGTKQMGAIIEDLLAYSRLERAEIKFSNMSLNVFIKNIISLNQKEIDDFQITIHQNIPEIFIYADFDGLTIAFRNVFENAIKFTKKQENPEITIGFEDNRDYWLIFVEDNGIGFDMNYKDKIFEIFQRLHRVEEYEGTGIGLAMVAKAMQRMGGRVWPESQPNKGAKFYLEIKK